MKLARIIFYIIFFKRGGGFEEIGKIIRTNFALNFDEIHNKFGVKFLTFRKIMKTKNSKNGSNVSNHIYVLVGQSWFSNNL